MNPEAVPFYPPYMLHRMIRPDEKVKNHIRNRLNNFLRPSSQFYGDNVDSEGYISLSRLLSTGSFRAYEGVRIMRLINEIIQTEHIYSLDSGDSKEISKIRIKLSMCNPIMVANSILF
jgi:hypothetical protein